MLRLDGFLVKQLHTKDNHVIKDKYVKFYYDENSNKFLVKDECAAPKQNYSKVDPLFRNLKAHKGPDEV